MLTDRYQQNVLPNIRALETTCRKTEQEIMLIKAELSQCNVEDLKAHTVLFTQGTC